MTRLLTTLSTLKTAVLIADSEEIYRNFQIPLLRQVKKLKVHRNFQIPLLRQVKLKVHN